MKLFCIKDRQLCRLASSSTAYRSVFVANTSSMSGELRNCGENRPVRALAMIVSWERGMKTMNRF